jgi:cytochrome c551
MRSNLGFRFRILDSRCWLARIKNPESRIIYLFGLILLVLASCTNRKSVKFEQYYVQGESLYQKNCANCHQANGTGLGLVYPPLNTSDYMQNNFETVLCLMKYGVAGELTVNGKKFNQPMPGVQSLTDLEIAEIATYIYNTWDHKRGIVEVTETSKVLKTCADQQATQP